MNTKLLGGVLLIVGTTIGGGMLALPMATSEIGFLNSTLLLLVCWGIMTVSAFLILEVNLWLPMGSNIISMAKSTLGRYGEWTAWLTYLLLLYSLVAAYTAGGGDFFRNLLGNAGIIIPSWLGALLFMGILGWVVYSGIRSVDYVTRGLMSAKFLTCLLLIALIIPHVTKVNLSGGEFKYMTASVTIAIASFGFATILPSLRMYFNGDVKKLRKIIWIGSLIPLVFYILWDFAVMGVIPATGDHGLVAMLHSKNSMGDFVNALGHLLNLATINWLAHIFTSICLATSFLGVSLGLSDFLADGMQKSKKGKEGFWVYCATFLPPLLIVLIYPGAFIKALSYAGVYCMILMVLLPAMMAWVGRYRNHLTGYRVPGGKPLLIFLIVAALLIIVQSF